MLRGVAVVFIILCYTALVCIALWTMALLDLVAPKGMADALKRGMDGCLFNWTGFNKRLFNMLNVTRFNVSWEGDDEVRPDRWYLAICNHQSWTDILTLQSTLWNRASPVKFFTKQELIWVPFIGLSMAALGFPYVKRVTKDMVAKNPALKDADRRSVDRACDRFKLQPTTILNFLEGTRFTEQKHARQQAKFKHLLNPKVGGLTQVVSSMDGHLDGVLDITISYPEGVPTFWQFVQGYCPQVDVHVSLQPVPEGVAEREPKGQRQLMAQWVDQRWQHKDARLANGS